MNKYAERAVSLNNLGLVARDRGNLPQARKYFEQAFAEMTRAMQEAQKGAAGSVYLLDVLRIMDNYGDTLREVGEFALALTYCQGATELAEEHYGADHPEMAKFYNNVGRILLELMDLAGAEKYFKRALEVDLAESGPNDPEVAIRYNNLGSVALTRLDYRTARGYFEKALQIDERTIGKEHPQTIETLVNLATATTFGEGNKHKALKYLERALSIARKRLGDRHPTTVTIEKDIEVLKREA